MKAVAPMLIGATYLSQMASAGCATAQGQSCRALEDERLFEPRFIGYWLSGIGERGERDEGGRKRKS